MSIPKGGSIWFCSYFHFIDWDENEECWVSPNDKKTREDKMQNIKYMGEDDETSLEQWTFLHACERDQVVKRELWKAIKSAKKKTANATH